MYRQRIQTVNQVRPFGCRMGLFAIWLLFQMVSTSSAGTSDSKLRAQLSALAPGESLQVLLRPEVLGGQRDISELNLPESLARGERYRIVREFLESRARLAQARTLAELATLRASGVSVSYRSHWIANLIVVEVDATNSAAVTALISSPAVASAFTLPKIESIAPKSSQSVPFRLGASATVQSNLYSINAPDVWSLGYTGKGRVICSFDTGVEGDHPALAGSWKGADGDSAAAWFDPVGRTTFPHQFSDIEAKEHGTLTMGIMVGHNNGDTIGVAPDARWISAAVIDIPGASIVDAFAWAADPDGDPNTISDVPDVINHSWGIPSVVMGCDPLFWELIDNTEALGVVHIFAAGNEGNGGVGDAMTIRNPANRARNELDCFAVGAANHRTFGAPVLEKSSSRGPSICDGVSIKPNLCAPGVNIRTASSDGGFSLASGSSMSAPHISGVVALLREKNPNATAATIKAALLHNALDLGSEGPDNGYGWGFVDALAALEALPEPLAPELNVFALTPNKPDVNGLLEAIVTLENSGPDGATASEVSAQVWSFNPDVELLDSILTFEVIPSGRRRDSRETLRLRVSTEIPDGSVIPLNLGINASGGYQRIEKIYILVGERVDRQFYTHRTDRLEFTVSNFGEYGFANGSFVPLGFSGFRFDGESSSSLAEMAFLLGIDSQHVSDGARNIAREPDRDFAPAADGALREITPIAGADRMTLSAFADTLAENPLGLLVRQRTLSWNKPGLDNLVALDYTIINQNNHSLGGVHAGLYADWDIEFYFQNVGSFSALEHFGYLYYEDQELSSYRGIGCLSLEGMRSHQVQNVSQLNTLSNPFDDALKYQALTSGFSAGDNFTRTDLAHFVSTGPYMIGPQDSVKALFVVMAGNQLSDLQRSMDLARETLDSAINSTPAQNPALPTAYELAQNFPNPFNPETTIEYGLPASAHATLEVYNLLGQKVVTLASGAHQGRRYRVVWNGENDNGESVASGMYLYRLKSGREIITRKMLLLR